MFIKTIRSFIINNNQLIRRNSSKSLILKTKAKKRSTLKCASESSVLKKVSKIKNGQNKGKFKARLPSDYSEDIWLENVNLQNLKLFRKTSFGSFRKIRINNLIQKLKQLDCSDSEVNVQNSLKKISLEKFEQKNEDLEKCEKNLIGQPQMSEYLVHNLMSFPLLKANCNDVFTDILKNEKEEYGLVDTINFPSVSTILNDTMPDFAKSKLRKWKMKLINEMGESEFKKHIKGKRERGVKLHSCLKEYLKTGSTENIKTDLYVEKCWKSLEKLLPNISEVQMIEELLYHPALMYKGIVDCVANYEGKPCVIDWKKSEKEKLNISDTFDAPLQVSAYLGALCWKKDANPLTTGLVVVAYTSGEPATVFKMDSDSCQFYWLEWLRRLQNFWLKRSSILDKVEIEF